ncbi:MAG: nicotinamide mononucleotide transporter [archaeon]
MILADWIGWISNIFFIAGAFSIARKNRFGFYVNGLGNMGYIIQGVMLKITSLWAISFILVCLNVYGLFCWKKPKKKIAKKR